MMGIVLLTGCTNDLNQTPNTETTSAQVYTSAANYPVWVARTVLPGQSSHLEDKFCLMVRGDVDR